MHPSLPVSGLRAHPRAAATVVCAVLAAICAVLAAGCTPAQQPLVAEVTVDAIEVAISDATFDLALPADIAVDGKGNLYVMDRRARQVIVVDRQGNVTHTIGRNGQGPGEFRVLLGIAIRNDRLYALDNAHGVQVFDLDGAYVSRYEAGRILRDLDFSFDGGLLFSHNRIYTAGALVGRLAPTGEPLDPIGEPVAPDAAEWSFAVLRAEILEARFPEEIRNHSLPIADPGGSVWVVLQTEAILRRYRADGALASAAALPVPELPAIERQYFEDFAALPGADVFFFPGHVADGVATDDALLLLWKTIPGEPGLVTVHRGGELVQRVVLPGLDTGGGGMSMLRMALDEPRRRLFISVSDIATVFGVDLPAAVPF